MLTIVSFGRGSEKEPYPGTEVKTNFTNPILDGADP